MAILPSFPVIFTVNVCSPCHYSIAISNSSAYINKFFNFFILPCKGGSNRLKGFKLQFSSCPLFQSIKRKGFRQVTKSAESLYFKRFSHIFLEPIVSKCGFTYRSKRRKGSSPAPAHSG